jgi:hypothetical protein
MLLEDIALNFLTKAGLAWWVEVATDQPSCTYYFGPFGTSADAKAASSGYVEDLMLENAQGIRTAIERSNPKELTVCDEDPLDL